MQMERQDSIGDLLGTLDGESLATASDETRASFGKELFKGAVSQSSVGGFDVSQVADMLDDAYLTTIAAEQLKSSAEQPAKPKGRFYSCLPRTFRD
jgi:hypothetical protein